MEYKLSIYSCKRVCELLIVWNKSKIQSQNDVQSASIHYGCWCWKIKATDKLLLLIKHQLLWTFDMKHNIEFYIYCAYLFYFYHFWFDNILNIKLCRADSIFSYEYITDFISGFEIVFYHMNDCDKYV